jgi:hypothetical protein
MEYYSSIKKNELASKWRELESIMLSEEGQRMHFPFICGS